MDLAGKFREALSFSGERPWDLPRNPATEIEVEKITALPAATVEVGRNNYPATEVDVRKRTPQQPKWRCDTQATDVKSGKRIHSDTNRER